MKKNKNKIHFNGHPKKVDKTNKIIVAHVKVIEVAEWLYKKINFVIYKIYLFILFI